MRRRPFRNSAKLRHRIFKRGYALRGTDFLEPDICSIKKETYENSNEFRKIKPSATRCAAFWASIYTARDLNSISLRCTTFNIFTAVLTQKKRLSVPPSGGTGKGALGPNEFLALNLRRGRRDRPSRCRLLRCSGREQARQL